MKKKKSLKMENFIFPAVLLLFLVFLIFKMQGFFDFTNKYGIERITSSVSNGEGALMLDDDALTKWNTYDRQIEAGDDMTLWFKEKQEISAITLQGENPDALEFYYRKKKKWHKLDAKTLDGECYTFLQAQKTDRIKIVVAEDATDFTWQVEEVKISE